MEQGELIKAFFKWLKGMRAYTPQELIDNSDHFSAYWSSWLRTNAYEIGKLDKDGRKKRREKKAKKKEEEKEEEEKKEEYDEEDFQNNENGEVDNLGNGYQAFLDNLEVHNSYN